MHMFLCAHECMHVSVCTHMHTLMHLFKNFNIPNMYMHIKIFKLPKVYIYYTCMSSFAIALYTSSE